MIGKKILTLSLCIITYSNTEIATLTSAIKQFSPGVFEALQNIIITDDFNYGREGITLNWKNDYQVENETIIVTISPNTPNISGVLFKYEIINVGEGAHTIRVYKITLSDKDAIWKEEEVTAEDNITVRVLMNGCVL